MTDKRFENPHNLLECNVQGKNEHIQSRRTWENKWEQCSGFFSRMRKCEKMSI